MRPRLGLGIGLGEQQVVGSPILPDAVTISAAFPKPACSAFIYDNPDQITISAAYPTPACTARITDTNVTISAAYPQFTAGTIQVGALLPAPDIWLESRFTTDITLNGSKVSQWNDRGSHSLQFVQGTAGNQPTFNASSATFNNQPSVTFVKANTTFLRASPGALALAQPLTLCFAFKQLDGNSGVQEVVWDTLAGTNVREILQWNATNIWQIFGGAFASPGFSNFGPLVIVWMHSSSGTDKFWDNVSGSPTSPGAGTNAFMSAPYTIGANSGGVAPIGMEFVGMFAYSNLTATNAQVAKMMAYFAMIYGIPAA